VGEESHLEEMRSAIRGDFARLAERRGEQELMRVSVEELEPEPATAELSPAEVEEPEPEEAPRSWFARFISP
jgi:hypothetical protein